MTSMVAVMAAAESTATHGAPSNSATAPARPAAPDVATHRGYGWVAVTARSSARAVFRRSARPCSTSSTSR